MFDLLSPHAVLEQVAAALSSKLRESMIIIGSLAAGYDFFGDSTAGGLRTKDVDCLVTPHAKAIVVATDVTEQLLEHQWEFRKDDKWSGPGVPGTPTDLLPMVRLFPPGQHEWFLELLGSPADRDQGLPVRAFERFVTTQGDFALCSFGFLDLIGHGALPTPFGLRIARPATMALANLLHHPSLSRTRIGGGFPGREIKRCNKDLGRVLALAYLANERDRNELERWPDVWRQSLQALYPQKAESLLSLAGKGIRLLLDSPADLDEALWTCNQGLLASRDVSLQALTATGRRFVQDVIEPIERE